MNKLERWKFLMPLTLAVLFVAAMVGGVWATTSTVDGTVVVDNTEVTLGGLVNISVMGLNEDGEVDIYGSQSGSVIAAEITSNLGTVDEAGGGGAGTNPIADLGTGNGFASSVMYEQLVNGILNTNIIYNQGVTGTDILTIRLEEVEPTQYGGNVVNVIKTFTKNITVNPQANTGAYLDIDSVIPNAVAGGVAGTASDRDGAGTLTRGISGGSMTAGNGGVQIRITAYNAPSADQSGDGVIDSEDATVNLTDSGEVTLNFYKVSASSGKADLSGAAEYSLTGTMENGVALITLPDSMTSAGTYWLMATMGNIDSVDNPMSLTASDVRDSFTITPRTANKLALSSDKAIISDDGTVASNVEVYTYLVDKYGNKVAAPAGGFSFKLTDSNVVLSDKAGLSITAGNTYAATNIGGVGDAAAKTGTASYVAAPTDAGSAILDSDPLTIKVVTKNMVAAVDADAQASYTSMCKTGSVNLTGAEAFDVRLTANHTDAGGAGSLAVGTVLNTGSTIAGVDLGAGAGNPAPAPYVVTGGAQATAIGDTETAGSVLKAGSTLNAGAAGVGVPAWTTSDTAASLIEGFMLALDAGSTVAAGADGYYTDAGNPDEALPNGTTLVIEHYSGAAGGPGVLKESTEVNQTNSVSSLTALPDTDTTYYAHTRFFKAASGNDYYIIKDKDNVYGAVRFDLAAMVDVSTGVGAVNGDAVADIKAAPADSAMLLDPYSRSVTSADLMSNAGKTGFFLIENSNNISVKDAYGNTAAEQPQFTLSATDTTAGAGVIVGNNVVDAGTPGDLGGLTWSGTGDKSGTVTAASDVPGVALAALSVTGKSASKYDAITFNSDATVIPINGIIPVAIQVYDQYAKAYQPSEVMTISFSGVPVIVTGVVKAGPYTEGSTLQFNTGREVLSIQVTDTSGAFTISIVDRNGVTLASKEYMVEAVAPIPVVADPSIVSVAVGAADTVAISNGTPPYTIVSDDTGVATVTPATLSGAGTVTITGVAEGSCTVTVSDSASPTQTAPIAVTVTAAAEEPVDPPTEQYVGSCDTACQTTAPMTVTGVAMDVNFDYSASVEVIAGVMSEDFSTVWWLTNSCTLSEDFGQAMTDVAQYLCAGSVVMPAGSEQGWVFWMVAPTASADMGSDEWWNTGVYELMWYQLP